MTSSPGALQAEETNSELPIPALPPGGGCLGENAENSFANILQSSSGENLLVRRPLPGGGILVASGSSSRQGTLKGFSFFGGGGGKMQLLCQRGTVLRVTLALGESSEVTHHPLPSSGQTRKWRPREGKGPSVTQHVSGRGRSASGIWHLGRVCEMEAAGAVSVGGCPGEDPGMERTELGLELCPDNVGGFRAAVLGPRL